MTGDKATVRRVGSTTVVEVRGRAHLASVPGVTCVNPDAADDERVYRKTFGAQKRIYLPGEYEQAMDAHLRGKYVLVIAINGYSSLTDAQCAAWGVKPGAYEKACSVLLTDNYRHIKKRFPDVDVRFTHGASDMGVDRAASRTAAQLRRPQLGFSCPQFLFYVPDDDHPVYVAEDQVAYSDAFVRSSDILIAANGRLQAFRMDIAAVFEYDKHFIPVNVLRLISTTGGPPAKNGEGKIEDAVAHYQQRVHSIGRQFVGSAQHDVWSAAVAESRDVLTHICRQILDPDVGLEIND